MNVIIIGLLSLNKILVTLPDILIPLTNNNSAISFMRDAQIFSFQPKLFDLIIFPHDLIHQVSPHTTDDLRISYAVNTKNIK